MRIYSGNTKPLIIEISLINSFIKLNYLAGWDAFNVHTRAHRNRVRLSAIFIKLMVCGRGVMK